MSPALHQQKLELKSWDSIFEAFHSIYYNIKVQIKYSELLLRMGAACQLCLQAFTKPNQQIPKKETKQLEPVETNRQLVANKSGKIDGNEFGSGKNSHLSEFNSSLKENATFIKGGGSTALFSVNEQKRSTIGQNALPPQSILFVKSSTKDLQKSADFYTLIDKIALVRKTQDCIKVMSPAGASELKCPYDQLFTTLTISEGMPIDSLEEFAPGKLTYYTQSPIKVKLILKCKSCKEMMKITYSKSILNIASIDCVHCEHKNWSLMDIQSSATVWADGIKLDDHQQMKDAPSTLRIMGCINCLRFSNCVSIKCGCLVCSECMDCPQASMGVRCRMCEGNFVL